MRYLTPEQEKQSDKIYIQSGLKGAAIGLGIGVVATALTLKRSANFRALSRPLQATMAAGSTVAGFMFASDRAVTEYENDVLGYTDEIMLEQLGKHQDTQHLSSFDKSLLYLNDNRWSFIGASWAASMVGALGYSFSNKYLTTQQKVVQARMYAQAVTIAVLMISAGVSVYVGDEDKKNKRELPDAQLRAVLELPHPMSPKHESKMVKQSSS